MTVAIVFLSLCVLALAILVFRLFTLVKRLDKTRIIDPSTLLGTPYALDQELANLVKHYLPLSVAAIRVPPNQAVDAAMGLRSACIHGVDQPYCLDLRGGQFLLITVGKLNPDSVANYFLSELSARRIVAKVGWAYTRSPDPAIRATVREEAERALSRVAGASGAEVALVKFEDWPAEDPSQVLMESLKGRREATCLTRREFAPLAGMSDLELRNLEYGRSINQTAAARVNFALEAVELAIKRATKLEDLLKLEAANRAERIAKKNADAASRIEAERSQAGPVEEKSDPPPIPPAPTAEEQESNCQALAASVVALRVLPPQPKVAKPALSLVDDKGTSR